MKTKTLPKDPSDTLFKSAPPAVQALRAQATREKRQADRKAWMDAQQRKAR